MVVNINMIVRLGFDRYLVLPMAKKDYQYFSHIRFVAIQTHLKCIFLEKVIRD